MMRARNNYSPAQARKNRQKSRHAVIRMRIGVAYPHTGGYGDCMHKRSNDATPPPGALVLNVTKLNELRKAHEIDTDTELAQMLGIDRVTLYRVLSGRAAPSNAFMARMKLAFPSVPLDALFVVDRLKGLAS